MRTLHRMLAALALVAVNAAGAQTFPDKPVRLVIPQTPGGSSDVLGRIIAQKLGEKWGKPVVVENRSGAGGNIGTDAVAKSAPDGYTMLLTYAGTHAINASLYRNLPFDPDKDFAAVATLATVPFVLVANVDLPVQDVKGFVALAKSKPGSLNYGAANGAVNHLLGVMLNRAAGVSTVHVPYRGAADSLNDTIGGVLQFNYASLPSVVGHVRAGKVRALAVASAKRSPALAEVPTMAEAGFPELTVDPWFGIFVPAGTPAAIVRKINADVNEALAMKDVVERFAGVGAQPLLTTPEQFAKLANDDLATWRVIVKESGAKVE
jgi:tripartite-type tricarboxylate transporter receptor subunit TctC